MGAVALSLPAPAGAQGGLDPAFGDGGFTEVGEKVYAFSSVKIYESGPQAGKIVVAGSDGESGGFLARMNADGSLDRTFGDKGTARPPGVRDYPPSAIALHADGSVSYAEGESAVVRRIDAGGQRDTEFGEVDLYDPGSTGYRSGISELEVDPLTGDLVVPLSVTEYVGQAPTQPVEAEIYKLDADGSNDEEWGGGTPAPVRYESLPGHATFVEVGADGSVWVAGRPYTSWVAVGVQHLDATGAPDQDFTPGIESGEVFNGTGLGLALEPGESEQPVLATGETLVRVQNDGTNAPGFPVSPLPHLGDVVDLDIDQNGRISVLLRDLARGEFSIFRAGDDGGADSDYGDGGATTVRWPGAYADIREVVVTPSTQMVGGYIDRTEDGRRPFGLARLSDSVDPVMSVPETTISSGPAEGSTISDPTPSFAFASSLPRSSFECAVDLNWVVPFDQCASPETLSAQPDGPVTFEVRAVSVYGVEDPTAASRTFTIAPEAPSRCDFYELQTPPTLRTVVKNHITANVHCLKSTKVQVKLRVTKRSAEAFGLRSRVIGSGRGRLAENERGEVEADLSLHAIRKLSRFRGATVYFKATVTSAGGGAFGGAVARYGEFTVGR